ncbi:MAG TPA: hypothetical protein VJ508_06875, partial [Saprospiraceae bacterium]|nr:hypothetical protein [Saprospiraceae bacterium]
LIEAKENGLYKSTDGGDHWSLVASKNIGNRPFYYSELYVDPKNENRIWNLYSSVSKSEDGGKTFAGALDFGAGVHPDHHAFWIDPNDPNYLIDGNDGGLNISRDGGKNWTFCDNLPVGQFYHLNVDNDFPYNLYGGMQDNGSWVGPSYVLKSGGIRNSDWRELYFGDGFDVLPKLTDTRHGWAMSQGGNLAYYDRETGFNEFIKPVHPDGIKLRFNWNAALAAVPGEPCGIYYGSQFVHKSVDCGRSWRIISPDLTTNDTTKQKQNKSGGLTIDASTAENNTTIICIAPSSLDHNVIWVGTDDGNLQLTRDGGTTWNNLISLLPGCPKGAWIPQIEVSPYNAGEAFVVVNNYRLNDWAPYLFHTTDYGATWTNIVNDKQVTSFVQCITQDPVVPDLLFLGADDGLYVSTDKGANWTRFPAKEFPRVSTMDIKVQQQDQSLAIATFGRALWVMDQLPAFRELAMHRNITDQKFKFFPARNAIETSYRSVDGIHFPGAFEYKGDNRQGGARFMVYVKPSPKKEEAKAEDKGKEKEKEKAKIEPGKKEEPKGKEKEKEKAKAEKKTEAAPAPMPADTTKKKEEDKDKDLLKLYVLSQKGDTMRYINEKLKEGWNTVFWDLRKKGILFPSRNDPPKDADDPSGEYIEPGTYKIAVTFNKMKDSTTIQVSTDPRLAVTAQDIQQRADVVKSFYGEVGLAQKAF